MLIKRQNVPQKRDRENTFCICKNAIPEKYCNCYLLAVVLPREQDCITANSLIYISNNDQVEFTTLKGRF